MAFSKPEMEKYERLLEAYIEKRRPPEHIRPKLDIGYRIKGQSVEIFEIRPKWRDPDVIMESSIAKTTYVRTKRVWRVFWMRSDLKWHGYDVCPEVRSLDKFIKLVEDDALCCFWG